MSEQIDLTDYADSDSEEDSEWTEKRLGEIFDSIYSGGTPKKGVDEYYDGRIPFVKIEDLNEQQGDGVTTAKNYITEKALEETSTRAFDSETLLMTIYGSLAETAIVQSRVATNQGILGLWDADDDNVLYVRYAIDNTQPKLASLSRQTTQANLGKGIVKKHKIPIPPLPEQRKIATVLYTIDRAIEKTEKVIEQVRTVKQGILQDLMNGVGSDHPLEEKRVGPRVVSLPKDWEVVQIGDALEREIIFEQQDGNHGSDYPRKDEFVNEGVPYLSAEMLSEGEVDFSQAKYLTKERANQLRIGFAKDGDVLLAHNATVGPTGLLETNREFVIIGTSLTYYRCNPDKLDSQYLTYFFQSGTFQKQLQDVMRQSTRNQVPITRQRNLHLILPPIQKQREISNQIDTVNKKLQTENQYQERLQRLKRGLQQDLLSGTVRTTDTNIQVPDEIAQHG